MFTQFFGNYLIEQGYITKSQLLDALKLLKISHIRLGTLAIHAGYMNSRDVDKVYTKQSSIPKRFGDLAIELGYLTKAQADELLSMQPDNYILLGQVLMELNHLSTSDFEKTLKNYKDIYGVNASDKSNSLDLQLIYDFYSLSSVYETNILRNYLNLFFNNLIRFIGDDFVPLKGEDSLPLNDSDIYAVSQKCTLDNSSYQVTIAAPKDIYIKFVSRYASEDFEEIDDYLKGCVEDFLNLHNGLFAVEMSENEDFRSHTFEVFSPMSYDAGNIEITGTAKLSAPFCFPFGTVYLIISN